MLVPPPERLSSPNIWMIEPGTKFHRVHSTYVMADGQPKRLIGRVFNPGLGAPSRFSFIKDARDATVPTLYLAETLDAAFYETVFHNMPATATLKTKRETDVTSRTHSVLETAGTDALQLAKLFNPDLKQWGIGRNDLIATSPAFYPSTVQWAEAIHRQHPHIQGLIWTSNQCDPDKVIVLFGDRVSSNALKILSSRDGEVDPSVLSDAKEAGRRAGIFII